MRKLYFLGGIPRSGSTLLGSLLNQHPEIYVSSTSPLSGLLTDIEASLNSLSVQHTFDREKVSYNVYSSILSNFYNHIEKPCIIDKHRFWGRNSGLVEKFLQNKPKIITTYRSIPEVLTSYISLINRSKHEDNFIDKNLRDYNIPITNNNRADWIWRYYVSPSYEGIVYSLNKYPEYVHLVEYNSLVNNPQEELNKVYNFLKVSSHTNTFDNIENTCGELKDEEWGLRGLHDIRQKLSKVSEDPIEIIGEENVKLYSKFDI